MLEGYFHYQLINFLHSWINCLVNKTPQNRDKSLGVMLNYIFIYIFFQPTVQNQKIFN